MKSFMFLVLLLGLSLDMEAQLLSVKKVKPNRIGLLDKSSLPEDSSEDFYKITLKGHDSDMDIFTHPISIPDSIDKLSLIEELLTFEGDKRLCVLPISNHNPLSSQVYMGELKRYSLQLEALYLINQIYFDEPFSYSPYPILKDEHGKQQSIKGKLLKKAYKHYRSWFAKVKAIGGIREAKEKGLSPFDSSDEISWYN